jgi:hypothetical protein
VSELATVGTLVCDLQVSQREVRICIQKDEEVAIGGWELCGDCFMGRGV